MRVFGSAWTPQFHPGGDQHFTSPATEAHGAFWRAKWAALDEAADTLPDERPFILMTHGPPHQRLDRVRKNKVTTNFSLQ